MIFITNNRSGVTHLTALVGGKPVAKAILGKTKVDDPEWEKAILEDADLKEWTTKKTLKEGHHLDPQGKREPLFSVEVFRGDKIDKDAGKSPFRVVPLDELIASIDEFTSIETLQEVIDKDPRPEATAAARRRIEVITKPALRTETP